LDFLKGRRSSLFILSFLSVPQGKPAGFISNTADTILSFVSFAVPTFA
jgi:hypothetical protein